MITYLEARAIGMYRMSADLLPYATHPEAPDPERRIAGCQSELAYVGDRARSAGLRLSFHADAHVILDAADLEIARRSILSVSLLARMLDAMGAGPEAVVVVHAGGIYGDQSSALDRFARRYWELAPCVRRRLVVENDDARFGVMQVLRLHRETGIPVVFDYLHHRLHNPDGLSMAEAVPLCFRTWQSGVRPKIHFSSPRTEWMVEPGGANAPALVRRTRWSYHADYANPFEFIDFLWPLRDQREFDVMLELRAREIALLQLRDDLRRFSPELAARLEPQEVRSPSHAEAPLRPLPPLPTQDIADA
jgi:UV DNA damage endonuclease